MAPSSLGDLLEWAQGQLLEVSDSARLDARVLIQHITGRSHADLIAHAGDTPTEPELQAIHELVAKRRQGTPVAYLTGKREFWSMEFRVTPATLIPRPETELLVERALTHIPPDTAVAIADIGTGSGAVALAIARERPRATILAIDNSEAALAIARENAVLLDVQNVEFRAGDLLSPLTDYCCELIVSNPPYVCENDSHLAEGDTAFEPRDALVSGPDGLDAIRNIVTNARQKLTPRGWLLLEHGFDQASAVRVIVKSAGFGRTKTYRDLAGIERVTECQSQ